MRTSKTTSTRSRTAAPPPKPNRALATRKSTAVAEAINFAKDADKGLAEMESGDLAIPFIRIIQSGSPIVKRSSPDYNPKAEEGMFINSVSGDLYAGQGDLFAIPCSYERCYIEWRQQKDGGGFVAKHPINSDILATCRKNDQNKNITPQGTEVQETAQYVALLLNHKGESLGPALLALSGTSLTASKHWNSVMKGYRLTDGRSKPMFSQIYELRSKPRAKGDLSWFMWDFQHAEEVTDEEIYEEARRLSLMAKPSEV